MEVVRLSDIGLENKAQDDFHTVAVDFLMRSGNTNSVRTRIADLIADGYFGNLGLGDVSLDMIQNQFRRFVDENIKPDAHQWHLNDELIPMPLIKCFGGDCLL